MGTSQIPVPSSLPLFSSSMLGTQRGKNDYEKTLESPLDCKEIQPVHPKWMEISPVCFLEGLMLKLKLQFFGHLMQRDDSFEKTLMLGKGMTEDELVGWTLSLPRVWVNSGSW